VQTALVPVQELAQELAQEPEQVQPEPVVLQPTDL
jgi:hypothetical protein